MGLSGMATLYCGYYCVTIFIIIVIIEMELGLDQAREHIVCMKSALMAGPALLLSGGRALLQEPG